MKNEGSTILEPKLKEIPSMFHPHGRNDLLFDAHFGNSCYSYRPLEASKRNQIFQHWNF